jgi:hypothetical protein
MGVRLVRSRQKSYGKRATVQSSSAVRTRRFLRRERRMHFLWSAACSSSRFDRVGNKCRARTLYLEEATRDAGRIGASSCCVRRIRNRLLPLRWRRSSDHVPESGWITAIKPQEARNHSHWALESSWTTILSPSISPSAQAGRPCSVPKCTGSSRLSYLSSHRKRNSSNLTDFRSMRR